MSDREKTVDRIVYRPNGKRLAIVKILGGDHHLVHESKLESYCRENDIESLIGFTEDSNHINDDERRNLIRDIEHTFDKERKKRRKILKSMNKKRIKKVDHIVDLDEQKIIDESMSPTSVVNGGYIPLDKDQIEKKYGETLEDYETARLDIHYRPSFYYEKQFRYMVEKEDEIIELKRQIRRLESSRTRFKEKYFDLLDKIED